MVTRNATPYGDRPVRAVSVAGAVDVSEPQAGCFKIKLGRDQPLRGVRLSYGPPRDPVTGEELDRSWRWQATLDDGAPIEFDMVWPKCAKDPITEAEFAQLEARHQWAQANAPDSAYAKRGRKIDPLSRDEPLPF